MTPTWSSAVVVLWTFAGLFSPSASKADTEHNLVASFQLPLPDPSERLKGPASLYANLSPAACRKKLGQSAARGAVQTQGPKSGIATPVRIVAPIEELEFKVPPKKSIFGNLDCRQALLWIHIAPVLAEHGVTSLQIDNFYRNSARIRKGKKSQHAYGLAADVTAVVFGAGEEERSKTGAALPYGSGRADVEDDFLGKRGEPVCGPKARILPRADSDPEQVARATRLRNLVCDLARKGAFHHILTPNYDAAHRNHLHMDLKRDNTWFSVE
jgi:hypothetical protein